MSFDRVFAEEIATRRSAQCIDGVCIRDIGVLVTDMLEEIDRLNGKPVTFEVGNPVLIGETEGRVTELGDGKAKVFYFNRAMQRPEEYWFDVGKLVKI